MFERIRKWYILGLWTAAMVLSAVDRNVLTPQQADAILRED